MIRTGTQASGCNTGVKFAAFQQVVLPNNGEVIFQATLTGKGINGTNNEGLWAIDQNGNQTPIAIKGQTLTVDQAGHTKKISAITLKEL